MAKKSRFPQGHDPWTLFISLPKALEELRADIRRRWGTGVVGGDIEKYTENIFLVLMEAFIEGSFYYISTESLKESLGMGRKPSPFLAPFSEEDNLSGSFRIWRIDDKNISSKSFKDFFKTKFVSTSQWWRQVTADIENKHNFYWLKWDPRLEIQMLNLLESDSMGKEAQLEKSQAIKEFKKRAVSYISANDISETTSFVHDIFVAHQKGVSFEEIKDVVQQETQALQEKGVIFSRQPEPKEPIQPPDLSEIPLWPGRKPGPGPKQDMSALDHLKTYYSQYLTAFSAEQNRVFQDQIRAHDRRLIQGLRNQLREEGKGRKVSDLVKTRSARVDLELENASVADLKRTRRLAATLYSRETRAAKSKATTTSRSITRK
jgi:hypothetical protein